VRKRYGLDHVSSGTEKKNELWVRERGLTGTGHDKFKMLLRIIRVRKKTAGGKTSYSYRRRARKLAGRKQKPLKKRAGDRG